jgi:hypothetical protein
MKKLCGVVAGVALIIVNTSFAQEQVTRIALVNSNIPSGAIFKEMRDHCQGVVLTIDPAKASFQLEAQINKESERGNDKSWLTLFNSNGEAVFATDAHGTGNAVKDVCEFLKLGKK